MTIVMAVITLSTLVSPGFAWTMISLGQTDAWRLALLPLAAVGALGSMLGFRLMHPAATEAAYSSRIAGKLDLRPHKGSH